MDLDSNVSLVEVLLKLPATLQCTSMSPNKVFPLPGKSYRLPHLAIYYIFFQTQPVTSFTGHSDFPTLISWVPTVPSAYLCPVVIAPVILFLTSHAVPGRLWLFHKWRVKGLMKARTHAHVLDALPTSFTCPMVSFYSYVEPSDCKCVFCKCHLQYLGGG